MDQKGARVGGSTAETAPPSPAPAGRGLLKDTAWLREQYIERGRTLREMGNVAGGAGPWHGHWSERVFLAARVAFSPVAAHSRSLWLTQAGFVGSTSSRVCRSSEWPTEPAPRPRSSNEP